MKKFSSLLLGVLLAVSTFFCITSSGCKGCSSCNKQADRSSYEITCSYQDGVLTGKETFTFYNSFDNTVKTLKFNLFGNAFRKDAKYSPILPQHTSLAYPNGISYGKMDIEKCTSEKGDLAYEICGEDQNILKITLLEEVFPEERVTVQIHFKLTLANVVARTGINDKTINLGNFYPILCGYSNGFYESLYYAIGDPFFSDCADYLVTISMPEKYTLASAGKQLKTSLSNGVKTVQCALSNARSFAMVLCSDFQTISATVNDTEIMYYYYEDRDAEKSLKFATDSFKLFSEKFGKYPYETYSVVQTMFVQGGMEYPTITFISDNIDGTAYGEVIVHETAHQWWQTVVGNNEIEYGFLDEGLAEYSVVLYFENYPEHQITRKSLISSAEQTYKVFCSVVDRLEGKVNTKMLRPLGDFSSEYEYVNLAYIKPCIMYDTLRSTIGDERFFKGLKRYYNDYSFKNATPYDLVGAFEKIGADTNGFFEGFFDGKVVL